MSHFFSSTVVVVPSVRFTDTVITRWLKHILRSWIHFHENVHRHHHIPKWWRDVDCPVSAFARNELLHQQYEKGAVRPFGRIVLLHFLLVMSTQNIRAQAARHDLVLLPVRRLSTSWNSTERPGADAAAMHIEGDEGGQSCGAKGPTTPMFARRVRVTVCDRANTPPLHHHQTASSRQQFKIQKRSEPKQDTR